LILNNDGVKNIKLPQIGKELALMNILFITEDHSIKNYGITSVVSQLADQLPIQCKEINVTILTLGAETVNQDSRVKIILVPSSARGHLWGWNINLSETIKQTIENEKIDLIHIHGIWMAAQWYALKIAKDRHIPCIISPHGMLTEWFWKNQGFLQIIKKKMYLNFILKPVVNHEVIFHAITPIELENLNRQFPNNPFVTIPNAINIIQAQSTLTTTKPDKQFLFLGRITPIKAVDLLIEAFYQAQLEEGWKVLIAGPEYVPEYVAKLKQIVKEYYLEDRILFTGPIYDQKKLDILQKTWALLIPSYAEVMGMVNLEAAIQNVPSITTYETGLWDWEDGGGMLIHPNVEEISIALKKASQWTDSERKERGKSSFELVCAKYSWPSVIPRWKDLYFKYNETINANNNSGKK
jgi:glycosyltransferase involved in cell wall biosynthesis